MTNRERLLSTLHDAELGCDDCLSDRSGICPRQTVNSIANRLHKEGRVYRTERICPSCSTTKLVNSLPGRPRVPRPEPEDPKSQPANDGATAPAKVWHWEGNVQARIVNHLDERGHAVRDVADTAAHKPGKDIKTTTPNGKTLWVSVKGFPEEKGRTNPATQARQWFSQALFDMILYRNENPAVELALGLPAGFATYKNLSRRIGWFKAAVPFRTFWVHEDGHVEAE